MTSKQKAKAETNRLNTLVPSFKVKGNDRLAYVAKWHNANKAIIISQRKSLGEVTLAGARRYMKERKQQDESFKLLCSLRSRLRSALKAKGARKTETALKLCGCSLKDLKLHLESQFVAGMTWGNHGAWHIDHIRPCASFDLLNDAELKACFHFSNLQPLWAMDNFRKNATYSHSPIGL